MSRAQTGSKRNARSRPEPKNHMRSSKSRSRGNKSRNNRPSGGNIVNRVFDSSGPDGKVRGTPQQIIEKYTQLHRDAQLSGDRVNAENFAQHAEHYLRMLAEAQKEIDQKRDEVEQQNRDRQAERDRQVERDRERAQRLRAQEEASNDPAPQDQRRDGDSNIVDTPESRGDQRPDHRNTDQRHDQRAEPQAEAATAGDAEAEAAPPKPKRAPRPRKPRAKRETGGEGEGQSSGSNEAAE